MRKPSLHRIGAISRLAGVPVSTLRIWELRHKAFSPTKTAGRHRLYSDEDLLKATLLKQLTHQGHAISTIANLDVDRLNQLRLQHQDADQIKAQQQIQGSTVSIAVIGSALASRIKSPEFSLGRLSAEIRLASVFPDIESAKAQECEAPPQILLVRAGTLHEIVWADIQEIARKNRVQQVIVLYSFGRQQVVHGIRNAGAIVRREPVSDHDLVDLISSVLLVDTVDSIGGNDPSAMIPSRRYSDEALDKVAGFSTDVLCECPRHVSEIIAQMADFEQYSRECFNKTPEDAQLHAYLCSIAGSARALFERALEMIEKHQGIDLQAPAAASVQNSG